MRPSEFPYRLMRDETVRRETFAAADSLKQDLRRLAAALRSIGERLAAVRGELSPALFGLWLQSEFLWSAWMAETLIQVAERPDEVLTDVDVGCSVAARQLDRARELVDAYREILRTDPAFAAVPRKLDRALRRERSERGRCRCLGVRARRRGRDGDESVG